MPISDAFAQIERQPNICDVVHIKYFDEEPLYWTLPLAFRIMDSTYALIRGLRLKVIVDDLHKIKLVCVMD
ncbi:hypothetical protein U9M48_030083 [Paspalum notatum var. saurae]|uniref:Uncharacterized protein n=1 Tax=Paspalum notatum var. saurae TaxID=547442 RepID=A0AAQ3TZD4_PASNO